MATTVSLINMKGGVGKTTVASQLAHAADRADFRVLAIDLDPQSNLSQSLMGPQGYVEHLQNNRPTIAQVFDDYTPAGGSHASPRRVNLDDIIVNRAGYWTDSSLDLIPSRLELSRTLKNPTGKERRLARSLARISDRYDLVLIDCAPTESILTDAAYFASRYVIVPVRPEFMATIGLPLLSRSLQEFQIENDDHEIEIAGLVFNHSTYQSGTQKREARISITEVQAAAKEYGWHIFERQIGYSASYPRTAREGTPLADTGDARAFVIEQFEDVKDEIFRRLGIIRGAP